MSKPLKTALIAAGVVVLSLIAAWLFGSERHPAPVRIVAAQVAPTLPAPVSVESPRRRW